MKAAYVSRSAWIAAVFVGGLMTTPAFADIQFGWAGPTSGGSADVGIQNRNGAEQAIADINAAGGVLGQKIAVEFQDDAGDPKQAVAVANKLAADGIKFVIGHQNSGASIAASNVYADNGMVEVTPASTNPAFTERGLWNVFRTCGRDDQQGTVAGKYLLQHFKGKKVFVVDDKTTYGKGLADEVKKAIHAGGLKEIGSESIDVGQKDYMSLVTKIKASGTDAVYFGGVYTEGGLIIRQLRDQGSKAQFLGGDAMLTDTIEAITGPGGEGTLVTFGPDARKNPAAKTALDHFKAKNIDPQGFTLYGYAAVQVLAQAIQAVGKPDAKLVAEKIHSGMTFKTVIGPLSYNKKGDITRLDFVFYKLKDGKFQELASR